LGQTVQAKRRGELAPATAPTIDDEVVAVAHEFFRWELARRLDKLEAGVDQLGWPAALAGLRAELAAESGEFDGRGVR
jgi:hypothetical protein